MGDGVGSWALNAGRGGREGEGAVPVLSSVAHGELSPYVLNSAAGVC
jgi:hypothetical protein